MGCFAAAAINRGMSGPPTRARMCTALRTTHQRGSESRRTMRSRLAGARVRSIPRSRARALGEKDGEVIRTPGDVNEDGHGATSIDMGYGGEGNAVKKSR